MPSTPESGRGGAAEEELEEEEEEEEVEEEREEDEDSEDEAVVENGRGERKAPVLRQHQTRKMIEIGEGRRADPLQAQAKLPVPQTTHGKSVRPIMGSSRSNCFVWTQGDLASKSATTPPPSSPSLWQTAQQSMGARTKRTNSSVENVFRKDNRLSASFSLRSPITIGKKGPLADKENDEKDEEEEEEEEKEDGRAGEKPCAIYARFAMISQTIERVLHLVETMQEQLVAYEAMLFPTSPRSPSPHCSEKQRSAHSSISPCSSVIEVQGKEEEKPVLLQCLRSVHAVLLSAQSTLQPNEDVSSCSRTLAANVEQEKRSQSRQASLDLIALLRAHLASFRERLENGLVDDAELTAQTNRLGFVVEYFSRNLAQPVWGQVHNWGVELKLPHCKPTQI